MMVGASKILTVSYGTFSCTLEGFDDPFSTMRSIAEYFRDLAADDRYFGAEPPTPDAEMLHRIAEREVNRRVEARVSGNGIVLRQSERAEAPRPAPVARSAEPAYEDAEIEPTPTPAPKPAPAAVAAPAAAPAAVADEADDSVAAKLSRIRAVVERARHSAVTEPTVPAEYDDLIEEETTLAGETAAPTPAIEEVAAEAPAAAAPEVAVAVESEIALAEDVAAETSLPEEASAEEAPAEMIDEDELDGSPHADTADAMAEAEDEVAELPQEAAAEDEPAFEESYDEEYPEAEAAVAPGGEDDLAELAALDAGETAPLEDTDADRDLADLERLDGTLSVEADESADEDMAEAEDGVFDDEEVEPLTLRHEDEPEAAEAEDELSTADAEAEEMAADAEAEDEAAETEDAPVEAAEPSVETAAEEADETADLDEDDDGLAARIVKIKRAEHEQGLLTEDDEDNVAADSDALSEGIRRTVAMDEAERAQAPRVERKKVLISSDPDREPSFDRILEETNSKMAETEGTRRRSAIAHLKAAVAATKADRLLNRKRSSEDDAEEQSAYREDLAKVVRPRPSEPRENAATKRPALIDETAAPLMLVSSQRIDSVTAHPSQLDQVRPRRIGAGMLALDSDDREDEEDDDTDFIAFAESVGARDLPDLLEAAAAYTAFVERQPHFSRPQIMRRAASIETEEEFTREAGLRSFGQLLRQGRIRKLQRGQFTIPETTRFRPQDRIAGE